VVILNNFNLLASINLYYINLEWAVSLYCTGILPPLVFMHIQVFSVSIYAAFAAIMHYL
jgi:hypothetical protein